MLRSVSPMLLSFVLLSVLVFYFYLAEHGQPGEQVGQVGWIGHEQTPFLLSIKSTKNTSDPITIYQCTQFRNGKHLIKDALIYVGRATTTSDRHQANWYLPCDYRTSDTQLKMVNEEPNWHWVGLLQGVWRLSSKQYLWNTLSRGLGYRRAGEIMPRTWSLPGDLTRFLVEGGGVGGVAGTGADRYVLKKDIHQQKGLLITANPLVELNNELKSVTSETATEKRKWVQIQEWLPDCLLYRGRKTNIRIWVAIINHQHKLGTFVYQGQGGAGEGIISYAALPTLSGTGGTEGTEAIDKDSAFSRGVASFYSSKALYDQGYPLTIREACHKNVFSGRWPHVWQKIVEIIGDVSKCVKQEFVNQQWPRRVYYQTFGYDFLIDQNCNQPRLIEINMGPGMEPHTTSDRAIRTDFHEELIRLLLGLQSKSFLQIL